ncbi:MAG TPA: T9SS type A sorting domain-containing protein, partial [Bacteroidota bacterium]|nr:T9SS type A sorting domain-containing protein [Bacteroidota bacterium]
VGNSGGIFLSTDEGSTWNTANTGLQGAIQVDRFLIKDTNIFVMTSGTFGVYLSTNNGGSWSPAKSGLPMNSSTCALAFDPTVMDNTTLFAGTYNGLYHTTNKGTSWTSAGFTGIPVYDLAFKGKTFIASTYQDIFLSTDDGSTWNSLNANSADTIAGSLVWVGPYLYVATYIDGIYRSTLFNASVQSPLPTIAPGDSARISIRLNAVPAGDILGKLLISSNAASSPDTLSITGYGRSYEVSVSSNNIVMNNTALKKDTIIMITNTGNQPINITMTSTSSAFSASPAQFSIPVNGSIRDTIHYTYMASSNTSAKIFISNGAFTLETINILANGTTPVGVDKETAIPTAFMLSQNYPNPFNPSTIIHYDIPAGTHGTVSIKVYDVLGREVATLVNETKNVGSYTVTFNASKLTSGVYLYRMQAGSFIQTRKLVLLR